MNGPCVYCTVYSFQTYLPNITVIQPLLLPGPLSVLPLNHHSIISCLLIVFNSITLLWASKLPLFHSHQHNLSPLSPLTQFSAFLPPTFLSLPVGSVFTHLLTMHHHEAFQQRSWSSLSDLCLLTRHLNSLGSECSNSFFFSCCKERFFQEPCRSASLQMHAYLLQLFGNSLKNVYLNNFLKGKKNLFTFSHQLFT